jgi:phosphonoacetate hydrolase
MLQVNNRSYRLPTVPTVVVCVDGCEPDYLARPSATGQMPWLSRRTGEGHRPGGRLRGAQLHQPQQPVHRDRRTAQRARHLRQLPVRQATGTEVMMNDAKWLRAPTLLAALAEAGKSVAVVTAKDKLRSLLGHKMSRGICFSSEKADQATLEANGITNVLELVGRPVPSVYSADLSEFVFAAGVKLMQTHRPDVMYLSTTDYIQHKHAPGTAGANAFYTMMDGYLGQLDAMGCVIALTADHGMNAKVAMDGTPDVIYLQDWFDAWLGAAKARVILPITDPYVVHHGALGSFATVYLPPATDVAEACATLAEGARAWRWCSPVPRPQSGSNCRPTASATSWCVSERFTVIGTSAAAMTCRGLDAPLRSHGGISEQRVPLIVNRKLPGLDRSRRFRNFDAFDLALNYAQ